MPLVRDGPWKREPMTMGEMYLVLCRIGLRTDEDQMRFVEAGLQKGQCEAVMREAYALEKTARFISLVMMCQPEVMALLQRKGLIGDNNERRREAKPAAAPAAASAPS